MSLDKFVIFLDPDTAQFYARIGQTVQRTTEQVLQDALFKLAGELSLEALSKVGNP